MFWSQSVDSLNCRCPWLPLCQPAKLVYSDAFDYACGSFIHSEGKIFQQNWSPVERNNSSTWRELKAVELALISFAPSLLGKFYQPGTEAVDAFFFYKAGSLRTIGYFLQFPKLRELSII